MGLLNNLIDALRIYIIPTATILRCVYCLFKMIYCDDEKKIMIKRIVNAIMFLILTELVFVIKDIVVNYY